MKILVIQLLIVFCKCIKFTLTMRCACSEFDENSCYSTTYCFWNGSYCIDLECRFLDKEYCLPYFTEYQCKWSESQQICQNHSYQCSELNFVECQSSIYILDCYWLNDQCIPQDCTINCNKFQCSMTSKECGNRIKNINCPSYTKDKCTIWDGYGGGCDWSTLHGCFNIKSPCSAFDESISFCNKFCYYDIHNQQCIYKECNQITDKRKCKSFLTEFPKQELIPCKWSNGQCKEMEIEDFDTQIKCFIDSSNSYWEISTQKCKFCNSLVKRRQYNKIEKKNDTQNNDSEQNDTQNIIVQNQQNGILILNFLVISQAFII